MLNMLIFYKLLCHRYLSVKKTHKHTNNGVFNLARAEQDQKQALGLAVLP